MWHFNVGRLYTFRRSWTYLPSRSLNFPCVPVAIYDTNITICLSSSPLLEFWLSLSITRQIQEKPLFYWGLGLGYVNENCSHDRRWCQFIRGHRPQFFDGLYVAFERLHVSKARPLPVAFELRSNACWWRKSPTLLPAALAQPRSVNTFNRFRLLQLSKVNDRRSPVAAPVFGVICPHTLDLS